MRRLLAVAALAVAAGGALWAGEPEPSDYRGAPYRGPVPETLQGAEVVETDAAEALWREGAAFVDVLPRPERPANLPEGTIWRDPPHDSIPGAIWLPNTGYEALAPDQVDYLLAGLTAATGGDASAPVVVFCLRDCWMSWNAAKRALEHGNRRVIWYPEGIDGWAEAGLPLERVAPYPP